MVFPFSTGQRIGTEPSGAATSNARTGRQIQVRGQCGRADFSHANRGRLDARRPYVSYELSHTTVELEFQFRTVEYKTLFERITERVSKPVEESQPPKTHLKRYE